jgi:WD40 repeat protein
VARWPLPLARPALEYLDETNPTLRLWSICDWCELLLRFITFIRIGELRTNGPLPASVSKELTHRLGEPTLGKWKGMALALTRESSLFIPELSSSFNERLLPLFDGGGANDPATSLFALRNRLAHGGGITAKAAALLEASWRPRLREIWTACSWLDDTELLGADAEGVWKVLSPRGGTRTDIRADHLHGMILRRGENDLPLWPFLLFGPASKEKKESVEQIYVRRGMPAVQYTALNSDDCFTTEGDDAATAVLEELLRSAGTKERSTSLVRGFEYELRRESDKLVGRDDEVGHIVDRLHSESTGVLWLAGKAGSGKSTVLARVVSLTLDSARFSHVIAYRFSAGDDRCSRAAFATFVLERFAHWFDSEIAKQGLEARDSSRRWSTFRSSLAEQRDKQVVFIVDGLDEIEAQEAGFASDLRELTSIAGRWLCAGRPEASLLTVFAPDELCAWAYTDGLPPLSEAGVRAMILEKIGPLRKRLLMNDTDDGAKVQNEFTAKLTQAAAGLPIYITYVIGDILAGRIRGLDGGAVLPASLASYHDELLVRAGQGPQAFVSIPLVALLAQAREPLDRDTISFILQSSHAIADSADASAHVRSALSAISSLITENPTAEGHSGFSLFHHSLRQHVRTNEKMSAPTAFARSAIRAAVLRIASSGVGPPYLWRQGISHLIDVADGDLAMSLLGDPAVLRRRLTALSPGPVAKAGIRALSADIALLVRTIDARSITQEFAAVRAFWARFVAHFERTAGVWPPVKLLASAAQQEPEGSPLRSLAAEMTSESTQMIVTGTTQGSGAISPCLRVLEAHPRALNSLCAFPLLRILLSGGGSADDSSFLLAWDLDNMDAPPRAWTVEVGEVRAVVADEEGRRALVLGNGGIAVVSVPDGSLTATAKLDGGLSACATSSGDWFVGDCRGFLHRLPNTVPGAALELCANFTETIAGIANWRAGQMLIAAGRTLHAFDIATRTATPLHEGMTPITTLALDPTATRCLIGDDAGRVVSFDLIERSVRAQWEFGPDAVASLAWLGRDRFAVGLTNSPSNYDVLDRTLHLVGHDDPRERRRLVGQWDRIRTLYFDETTTVLFSGGADYTLRLWDTTIPYERLPAPAELIAVGSVRPAAGGTEFLTASDDKTVRRWRAQPFRESQRWTGHNHVVWTAVEHPVAPWLFSVSEDGTLRVWSSTGAEVSRFEAEGERLFGVTVSSDGRWLAVSQGESDAGAQRPCVHLWDLAGRYPRRTFDGPVERLPQLAFSPDGQTLFAASWDSNIYRWDVASGTALPALTCGNSGAVGIAIHPRGHVVVGSHVLGGGLTIHHLADGTEETIMGAHQDQIRRLVFTPSGDHLISGGDDETVRTWEFPGMKCIDVCPTPAWVTDLALLRGGSVIAGLMNGDLLSLRSRAADVRRSFARRVVPWRPTTFGPGIETSGEQGSPAILCIGCQTVHDENTGPTCPACGSTWTAI